MLNTNASGNAFEQASGLVNLPQVASIILSVLMLLWFGWQLLWLRKNLTNGDIEIIDFLFFLLRAVGLVCLVFGIIYYLLLN